MRIIDISSLIYRNEQFSSYILQMRYKYCAFTLPLSIPLFLVIFFMLNSTLFYKPQMDSHAEPMIIVRKHTVLIALSPLLAIVTADRVILSVPDGADSLLYILQDYLVGELS